jgi:hypothetical protein
MRKSFVHALAAALYIIILVLSINATSGVIPENSITLLIPMVMLSLLVLSVLVMGYLFLFEPLRLYMENQKGEAVAFFGKTVGFFACFILIFLIILFLEQFIFHA